MKRSLCLAALLFAGCGPYAPPTLTIESPSAHARVWREHLGFDVALQVDTDRFNLKVAIDDQVVASSTVVDARDGLHRLSWDTRGYPSGTYRAEVSVQDTAGNTAAAQVQIQLEDRIAVRRVRVDASDAGDSELEVFVELADAETEEIISILDLADVNEGFVEYELFAAFYDRGTKGPLQTEDLRGRSLKLKVIEQDGVWNADDLLGRSGPFTIEELDPSLEFNLSSVALELVVGRQP